MRIDYRLTLAELMLARLAVRAHRQLGSVLPGQQQVRLRLEGDLLICEYQGQPRPFDFDKALISKISKAEGCELALDVVRSRGMHAIDGQPVVMFLVEGQFLPPFENASPQTSAQSFRISEHYDQRMWLALAGEEDFRFVEENLLAAAELLDFLQV